MLFKSLLLRLPVEKALAPLVRLLVPRNRRGGAKLGLVILALGIRIFGALVALHLAHLLGDGSLLECRLYVLNARIAAHLLVKPLAELWQAHSKELKPLPHLRSKGLALRKLLT